MYTVVCMSFDGEFVREHKLFNTIEDANSHIENLGSKWYFYPFAFVTTEFYKTVVDAGIIEELNGKRLKTVSKLFEKVCNAHRDQKLDIDQFIHAVKEEIWK